MVCSSSTVSGDKKKIKHPLDKIDCLFDTNESNRYIG